MKVKKAEITAFLSLIVVLLISFIFGIIEITVIQTEKNLSRICADGAIFSVFGEYESQLMEAYHIFGLDGSYGTGEFNEDKIIGRMHYYSNKNIDYKINGIQYLTDNKGQAFREQVLTYYGAKIWNRTDRRSGRQDICMGRRKHTRRRNPAGGRNDT